MTQLQIWRHRARFLPIKVKNIVLATVAAMKYGYPQRGMRIIGITGTDGKSTTATMLYSILKADGRKVGLVSTLGAKIDDKPMAVGLHVSTPGPLDIFKMLSQMKQAGVTDVVLETTSHALDQRRVFGLHFDVAILTNITPEHLDYHLTMQHYKNAKAKLFKQADLSVLNAEDGAFKLMAKNSKKVWRYGISAPDLDVWADQIEPTSDGSQFTILSQQQPSLEATIHYPGRYNIMNALAATAAAMAVGVPAVAITNGLDTVRQLDGRFEMIQQQPFAVIVDFAHTAHAFEEVLPAARALVKPGGKLYHLFGSAAERDTVKRVDMGRISGELADVTVLTSDDARHENIDTIQGMLLEGLLPTGKKEGVGWVRIDDRAKAIQWVIDQAKPGDVVLLAGKGHEKSLAIGGQEMPWSDQEQARLALAKRF